MRIMVMYLLIQVILHLVQLNFRCSTILWCRSNYSRCEALSKTGNQMDVAVDDSSIEVNADALRVKALGITNAMLAGSIDGAKIENFVFTDESSTQGGTLK